MHGAEGHSPLPLLEDGFPRKSLLKLADNRYLTAVDSSQS